MEQKNIEVQRKKGLNLMMKILITAIIPLLILVTFAGLAIRAVGVSVSDKLMQHELKTSIYAVNQNYPTKDCYCYVQTEEDYKNRLMSLAFFHVKEHCFVPLVPSEEDMMDDIKYWRMYDNPKPLIYCSSKPFSDEVSEK